MQPFETWELTSNLQSMKFAAKLTDYMARKNLSLGDLADVLGVSKDTVSRLAKDDADPRISLIQQLAAYSNLPVSYWADDKMEEPPPSPNADETTVLRLARELGYDLAIKRLALVPEIRIDGRIVSPKDQSSPR
jgi:transcriptional regulator with XRE-family HTH domain